MEVEVRGLTDNVDTDFLILYLESKRRSGGGPVSSFTRTGSQALVTFENISDAENVLSREEHHVQSVTIHVRRLPPWDPGKVALCSLHPEIDMSLLELYVEKVSGREHFVLVRSSDQKTVLVIFHEPLSDEEFDLLERRVQMRSVHGSSPSVQRVRLCAEVMVEDLGGSVTAELLEMYFENRRSGGGKVNSVTMLRNNSAAIVSFSDASVATQVLSHKHSLQNRKLTVSPYYPALMGSPSTEETGPPEEEPSEASEIEEGSGNGLQQTATRTEEKMEVQDWQEELLSDPVIVEPPEVQARGSTVSDQQNTGPCQAQRPEEETQAAAPMVPLRDTGTKAKTVAGATGRSMQEAVVHMDRSELRFMQEYKHDLLAGMHQVTIVPLEAEDKCGFKVAGDAVSCKTAEELLRHMVSSLPSQTVTLQYPGLSLFLLEEEGQRAVQETERLHKCIIDTSDLSWKVTGRKHVDPWSYVHFSEIDTSPVQSLLAEELSEAAETQQAADIEDVKAFASLLKSSQSEEDKEETLAATTQWNIKQEDEDLDLYTDTSAKGQDEGTSKTEDEELEQAFQMSRDEFQNRQLDEEAQLLLAIQMSMDTQATSVEDEDRELQKALKLSLRDQILEEVEEPLQRALEMSLRSSWVCDEMSPGHEDLEDVSEDEMVKAVDTVHIKVQSEDKTNLVVACDSIRNAVAKRLCTVTLDGIHDFQFKAEILSALEKKHKVKITEREGQAQIQGFLQNPLKCQEELSRILSALHSDCRSQAGLMALDLQQTVVFIPVSEMSEEYDRVVQQFFSTLKELRSDTQVLQVQKVQNALLYNQYQMKKQSMLAQCPGRTIERTLYHGTSENGAKEICHHGFDRSFCGKNATFYGHGVYFASESAISARDKYSPPSNEGNKYILVAQVLTGEFTLGKKDMKTPPIKPDTDGDVPQRYDSLVDSLQNPVIFVIFNDTQAYPQYLITCCNKRDVGK